MPADLFQTADQLQAQGRYTESEAAYSELLEKYPEYLDGYWRLGLSLLLQGRIEDAQTTWLTGMFAAGELSTDERTIALVTLLSHEAQTQFQHNSWQATVWICQQIREFVPDNVNNLILLLNTSIKTRVYDPQLITEWQLVEALQNSEITIAQVLLKETLQLVLECNPVSEEVIPFIKVAVRQLVSENDQKHIIEQVFEVARIIDHLHQRPDISAQLGELVLQLVPDHRGCLRYLNSFYKRSEQYHKAIESAYQYLELVETIPDRVDAITLVLKNVAVTGGRWQEGQRLFTSLEQLTIKLIEQDLDNASILQIAYLINSYFFAPYYQDKPAHNRQIQNQLAQLCQTHFVAQIMPSLCEYPEQHIQRFQQQGAQRKLKVGYLSSCLRRHSVGWLARALFEHHDPESIDVYTYLLADTNHSEPLQDWYIEHSHKACKAMDTKDLAEAIQADEIDILIELDSITMDMICTTVMLKPAPIQVTWLGWDASGIPAIDYFIADPYVLPDHAQDYYQEQIYRLPQTYIAVDGFEVGLPTLRREDFDIPVDAVVYYSVQQGFKRHPDTMRLQLKIVKQVPGSYFCIKGSSDNADMQKAFLELADEVGVERDRLKFLGVDALESTHRANMGVLADIVLDTYPYNGATTTMETLWMGIPLVTWVGEQFSARNSYTMLKNVGVEAGIAHNAEEYVEWGVRLGTDHELRKQVAWQLHQSRRDAPLWNGRQFARDMEAAYEQMWANYVEKMNQELQTQEDSVD